eukprot:scpid17171/ scgid33270/ 
MAESHMKTRAYQYGKDFKIDTFLTNLQAYRLAAGEVNPGDYASARQKHGQDDGAVFGEIISASATAAVGSKGTTTHSDTSTASARSAQSVASGYAAATLHPAQAAGDSRPAKRKRKRRKRKSGDAEVSYSVPSARPKKQKPDFSASLVSSAYASSSSDSDSSHEVFDLPDNLLPQSVVKQPEGDDAATTKADCQQEKEEEARDYFNLDSSSDNEDDGAPYSTASSAHLDSNFADNACAVTGAALTDTAVSLTQDQLADGQRCLTLPEDKDRQWSYSKHKWSQAGSSLSTYKCWKCNRVGHLPQDCVSTCNIPSAHPSIPGVFTQEKKEGQQIYSKLLRDYYGRCRQLQRKGNLSCAECGACSNLANCLDCGMTFCDGRGHLASHLLQYTSHRKLYSGKLKRQVKCCKPTCEVMDVSELYCCSACWAKVFDRHYSMINATWSSKGLSAIVNGLCCEEHFHWHRMNCETSTSEQPFSMSSLREHAHPAGTISEFLF